MRNPSRILATGLFLGTMLMLQGCAMVAAAGAGAVGGYEAKRHGYEVQPPIKHEPSEDETQ